MCIKGTQRAERERERESEYFHFDSYESTPTKNIFYFIFYFIFFGKKTTKTVQNYYFYCYEHDDARCSSERESALFEIEVL